MGLLSAALVTIGLCGGAAAQDDSFAHWRAQFRSQALAAGITPATFERAMAGVRPIPRVIELDHAQPESKLRFSDYVKRLASEQRRASLRQELDENRALLDEIGQRYRVQPRFIVALWGVETDFGKFPGDFPVIASLATLAYDGRRAALFTRELIAALRIVQRDGIPPSRLRGSWAGAMGQCQFMPSSFLQYAVSYQGDGRPDIWTRRADVFASIANYLARLGWRDSETWGRYVQVPPDFSSSDVGFGVAKSLAEWRRLGVRREDGGPLPAASSKAALLMPEGEGGPALLAYGDFRTLLRWNNSQAFATSVGLLADSGEMR
jgi:membrane-bound lytic murein transglycosylase B